jgi:UDP-3-O-[3-hydroxymyristoyl] glucosamine N-acyltransferase
MAHTVSEIAAALNASAEGETGRVLRRPAHPAEAGPDDLAIAFDDAHAAQLGDGAARVAVLAADADWRGLGLDAAILVERPRYALAGLTERFRRPRDIAPGVHPTAVVAEDAELGEDVAIGPFCVIGAGARIGARTILDSHVSESAPARESARTG